MHLVDLMVPAVATANGLLLVKLFALAGIVMNMWRAVRGSYRLGLKACLHLRARRRPR